MNWLWCETCECACVKCEVCKNISCSGGGCEVCDELFEEAIRLSDQVAYNDKMEHVGKRWLS
jgi:hypothetical protein